MRASPTLAAGYNIGSHAVILSLILITHSIHRRQGVNGALEGNEKLGARLQPHIGGHALVLMDQDRDAMMCLLQPLLRGWGGEGGRESSCAGHLANYTQGCLCGPHFIKSINYLMNTCCTQVMCYIHGATHTHTHTNARAHAHIHTRSDSHEQTQRPTKAQAQAQA